MQAIVTKYLGATNHRPGRIKATAEAGSVTVSWDHTLDIDDNHAAAAKALCEKLEWDWRSDFARWVPGWLNGKCVWVWADKGDFNG